MKTLKELLEEQRKQMNQERDIREQDGWSGGPRQTDRPDPIYYHPRKERNLVHRPSRIYS